MPTPPSWSRRNPDGSGPAPEIAAPPPSWSRRNLDDRQAVLAAPEWFGSARLAQYPVGKQPDGWLVIGGRGAGKTRLGAEWVNGLVRGLPPFTRAFLKHGTIALVGETLADVREVMIDGPSGIRTVARGSRPRFETSRRRLVWPCGAVAQMFSSEDPESLRGPQFHAAWCDEVAKWKNAEACYDMLRFGLRLGERPRALWTTTPRPTRLMKRLLADPAVMKTRMTTRDNAAHLAAGFLAAVEAEYGGTRLGRQELDGELIDDRPDALWSRTTLERAPAPLPEIGRIVVAVDPPASAGKGADACGIVAAGLGADGVVYVLADASLRGARPPDWAAAAVRLWRRLAADCLVAEVNQGGDMVRAVIAAVDPAVPVKAVRAQRGKWLRAEPVAALYEQGRVRHAARFPELEDEMCDFGADGLSGGRSPDRVDALVWAVAELTAQPAARPRVRGW